MYYYLGLTIWGQLSLILQVFIEYNPSILSDSV